MGMGVFARTVEWIRGAMSTDSPRAAAPVQHIARESDAGDGRLVTYLSDDLVARTTALRTALANLDPSASGSSREAFAKCMEEIERLEELAVGLATLAVESEPRTEMKEVDLCDALRRATALHNARGSCLPVRIREDQRTPYVLATSTALSRTFALCLESTSLIASPGSTLWVDLRPKEAMVEIQFSPSTITTFLPPRLRDRQHSILGLATRIAAAAGARIEVAARGDVLIPRLSLQIAG